MALRLILYIIDNEWKENVTIKKNSHWDNSGNNNFEDNNDCKTIIISITNDGNGVRTVVECSIYILHSITLYNHNNTNTYTQCFSLTF